MKPDFQTLPLPEIAHIPGINPRPKLAFLESIAAYAEPVTEEQGWKGNLPWLYGIQLFNNGYYWEAHEVWETVWMNGLPNSREKQFVQGAIHFANGLLKIKMDRSNAASRLFALANECFGPEMSRQSGVVGARYMGLDLNDLSVNLDAATNANCGNVHEIELKYEI